MKQDFQDQFLDELLIKARFEEDDDLDLIKEDLIPILQERINMHIYQAINEEQTQKITELLDENKIDEANTYIQSILPNYDEFLMEIYAQFEDEYLENMQND